MTTALTLYPCSTASLDLTNSDAFLLSTSGAVSTSSTTVTTNASTGQTGYGKITSKGTTAYWPALGALPAFGANSNGWILDKAVLNLEGQQFVAGNWSGAFQYILNSGSSNITANLYLRVGKYNVSTLAYTSWFDLLLSAQSVTQVIATYTWAASAQGILTLATNERLFLETVADLTVNANPLGKGTYKCGQGNSLGVSTVNLITPGYQATGGGGGSTYKIITDHGAF